MSQLFESGGQSIEILNKLLLLEKIKLEVYYLEYKLSFIEKNDLLNTIYYIRLICTSVSTK